jgi:hypothetical protein
MKKLLAPVFFSLLLTPAFSQHINTDAITRFWQVVDHLELDLPLNDSLWNAFYNARGNKDYMIKNRPRYQVAEYRRDIEFVFRPSLRDSLKSVEAADTNVYDDILENLMYIRTHEQELRAYTTEVTTPAYLESCILLARQYLPKGKRKRIPGNLTIYIMVMAFDAAVQDSSMYFGLARMYEYDRFRKGALAGHEMHHQQRVNRKIGRAVSSADSAGFYAIDQINNEGSADLVDKMLLLDNPGKIFRGTNTVHRLIDPAPAAIRLLDSCFRINAVHKNEMVTITQLDRIMGYSSGHLPGMFMVDVIRRGGLEAQLIQQCDNPFEFFFLYNKAAAQDSRKPPLFAPETIAYLRKLERRCF